MLKNDMTFYFYKVSSPMSLSTESYTAFKYSAFGTNIYVKRIHGKKLEFQVEVVQKQDQKQLSVYF